MSETVMAFLFLLIFALLALATAACLSLIYIALPSFRRIIKRGPFARKQAMRIAIWNVAYLCALFVFFASMTFEFDFLVLSAIVSVCMAYPFYWINMIILTAPRMRKERKATLLTALHG